MRYRDGDPVARDLGKTLGDLMRGDAQAARNRGAGVRVGLPAADVQHYHGIFGVEHPVELGRHQRGVGRVGPPVEHRVVTGHE